MYHILVSQYCQLSSYTDTIVGSQCRTFRLQPFTVYISFYRIFFKIMYCIAILLTHHIHVWLQNYFLQIFLTREGSFSDQNISCLIHLIFQTMRYRKVYQISSDFFFLLGRTGNLTNLFKIVKHRCWFQILFFHTNSFVEVNNPFFISQK